ncbi:hypothetical protein N8T08_009201 [Aspergillus melleus]|uniref:Uncharacterized protein n=1 Tax=Aspergillus melleus TaxID=138277 RepID=A0ACC3AU78_9EURO|nr:hypothetical protein N8T08_009201 [Aspergillus melleus]
MTATPESAETLKPSSLVSCIRFLARYRWQFLAAYLIVLGLLIGTLMPTFKGNDVRVLKGNKLYQPALEDYEKSLVLAKSRSEDISWAYNLSSDWGVYIYTSDREPGFRTTPANKGREGMSYLTHIIDNYDDLTDITVFMHGAASQWHNDLEDNSHSSFLLSKLRMDAVTRKGYTNLRCQSRPGCPVAMRPSDPKFTSMDDVVYTNFTSIYTELFDLPEEQVPNEVGGICCGQFALTKKRIRQRPREEYIRMRDWAISTPLDNFTVGSVFEMLWHLIFLENSVSCPDPKQCYCDLYGVCDD